VAVRSDSSRYLTDDHGGRLDHLVIEVDRHVQQHAATIRVHGEIDVATAPALQGELEAVLGDDVRRLVLDLSGVRFCDVSGLNLLLRIQSRLASHGGHLTVVAACRPLRIMVFVLGLEGRLPLSLPAAGDRARTDDAQATLARAGAATAPPRRPGRTPRSG
jgi:anti-sigma B factor antagonist